jgi:hypothetical protein
MVLRRRYWLYYALQFMSGARRQIFVVFAAFMMVERFGFAVHEITALFMATLVANMIAAPLSGPGRGALRRTQRRWLRIRGLIACSWPMAGSTGSAGAWCWRRRSTC